jgi:hypothetical protein
MNEGVKNKIDIDKLSEPELVELNHRIIARLRFLNETRSHNKMLQYKIGARVSFQPDGHPLVTGIITKYEKR